MNRPHLTIFLFAGLFMLLACGSQQENIGETSITKWQNGKAGAVSLTYDDGTINQFRKALPIMNELNFNATFFINTGKISGSQYHGKFIGRSVKQVIEETATIPTKYMRERMNATHNTNRQDGKITVTLKHSLDTTMYRVPLTLKRNTPVELIFPTIFR